MKIPSGLAVILVCLSLLPSALFAQNFDSLEPIPGTEQAAERIAMSAMLSEYIMVEQLHTAFVNGDCGMYLQEGPMKVLSKLRANLVSLELDMPEWVVVGVRKTMKEHAPKYPENTPFHPEKYIGHLLKLYRGEGDRGFACGLIYGSVILRFIKEAEILRKEYLGIAE